MMIYGMTGGIACGKSTLSQMMREAGWMLVDSDSIAHKLLEPGQTNWKKVVDAFGENILNSDRTINRRALGDLVFSQPARRQQLNALTHPAIREVWLDEMRRFPESHPQQPMVVTIPLLFECHLQQEFDAVVCVACSAVTQIRRLLTRGLSEDQARQRLASQWSVADKMNSSDYVIWNEGSLEALRRQFHALPRP